MDTVAEGDETEWFYIFTRVEEMHKQTIPEVVMQIPFADMLDTALKSDKVAGLVINPFGQYFKLDKQLIKLVQKDFNENWNTQ
ncbi:MAG: SseB family protein [Agathobacter sp.]|nr:SseB family protein [Agathobacter sp.]